MEGSKKSEAVESLLSSITGRSRIDCIRQNICTTCGKEAVSFRDSISRKEYLISGMCQACQDKVFGKEDE